MAKEEILIEYLIMGLPPVIGNSRRRLRIYSDGKVEVRKFTPDFDEDENGIVLKKLKIPLKQAYSYTNKLIQAGFFNFKDNFSDPYTLDGLEESITINYNGRTKTIRCLNRHPSSEEFESVIVDLEKLVSE